MEIWEIVVFIGIGFGVLGLLYTLLFGGYIEVDNLPCYDKAGNVINGLTCVGDKMDQNLNRLYGSAIFILAIGLIIGISKIVFMVL